MNIFVTTGTTDYKFDRLISKMDRKGVFMQIGKAKKPKKAKYKEFLTKKEMIKWIEWSDIIISHGGTGSIIEAIEYKKKLIIIPRQKKFKEHIDDHQINFCNFIKNKYNAEVVLDINNIENAIKRTKKIRIKTDQRLINEIENLLD